MGLFQKKELTNEERLRKAARKAGKDYGVIKAKSLGEKITLAIAFVFMMIWALL